MINCHTHTFTIDHVPRNFLPLGLPTLMRWRLIRKPLTWLSDSLWPFSNKDQLSRLSSFIESTYEKSQEDLLRILASFYPPETAFVILPMDMEFQGAGKLKLDLYQQLQDIVELKGTSDWKGRIYPFVPVDPRRPNLLDFVKTYIEDHGFKGIKMYPALGFWACDPRLDGLYEYCQENGLPITSHCSRGGVYFKGKLKNSPDLLVHPITGERFEPGKNRIFTERLGDPEQFEFALRKFPNLKINFAHFGGATDWDRYLKDPYRQDAADIETRGVNANWVHKIKNLIANDEYPNVYTDISYTLHEERFIPLLKLFLLNPKLRDRVLFGTDFYMLEQDVAEREIAVKFRFWIGETDFKQLAVDNNKAFLENRMPAAPANQG